MHGIKRVIVFCILTTFLPITLLVIPLYLRHSFFANVAYAVTESDILEIDDGISTIFCSKHTLQMNASFNAFQMSHKPEITSYRKHIRLKKSMNLPDDTLEYWGFYLLKGATVALSVCSRFQGASILVVKGEKNLRTCGMLEHNDKKIATGIFMPEADRQVKIIFESSAQEVNSNEQKVTENVVTTSEKIEELFYTTAPTKKKTKRKLRHAKRRLRTEEAMIGEETLKQKEDTKKRKLREMALRDLEKELNIEENHALNLRKRTKRNQESLKPPSLLDQGIKHGGNAIRNFTDDESSVSSFEMGLFDCYGGAILIAQEFEPSDQCINISYLLSGKHMQTRHNVVENGYYYYIFYSDNDFVSNDIHALFDIYKPTFQYENVTDSCINKTECSFNITPMSTDRVIVEIPTRDGIEHELDDFNLLTSICHPRMTTYMFFPIAVLFFILSCAFL